MKNVFTSKLPTAKFRAANAPRILHASTSGDETTLEIFGPSGASPWDDTGISPQQVADTLKGSAKSLTLRINSPGGSMFDGITIYNLLKSSGKTIRVIVDGLAASAASVIAMAGESIEMGEGAMIMIHNAMAMSFGDGDEMRSMADILDNASASMADIYAARTGMRPGAVLELMAAETWMTADRAIALKFATGAFDRKANPQAVASAFNLSAVYDKTPEALKVFKPSVLNMHRRASLAWQ